MGMIGADVEELRALAKAFESACNDISGSVISGINQALGSSTWQGADATAFRSLWQSKIVPSLNRVLDECGDAAKTLRTNADDQERTSSTLGGGTSSIGNSVMAQGEGRRVPMPVQNSSAPSFSDVVNDVLAGADPFKDPFSNFASLGAIGEWVDVLKTGAPGFVKAIGGHGKKLLDSIGAGFGAALPKKLFGMANAVGLGFEFVEAGNTILDPKKNVYEKATAGMNFAGSALQAVPNPASFLAGTSVKTATLLGEEIAKIDPTLPEGWSFFDAVAGKKVDKNPVVAFGEVASGAGRAFADATKTVWKRLFG